MKHQKTSAHWPMICHQLLIPLAISNSSLDRLAGLELKMEQLIRAIEVNNELLRTMQEQQNRVCTSGGGGSVIVGCRRRRCPPSSLSIKYSSLKEEFHTCDQTDCAMLNCGPNSS